MATQYITCVDCRQEFEHPERDQDFYAEHGYAPPKRCKLCRIKKKARFDEGQYRDGRARRSDKYEA